MPLPIRASLLESLIDTIKERIWIIAGISALAASIGGMIKAGSITGGAEGFGLLIFAAIIIVITSLVDYIKDSRFVTLQQLLKNETVSVIRGKAFQTRTISVWDLVVGDVILLDSGDRVPADCLIIE